MSRVESYSAINYDIPAAVGIDPCPVLYNHALHKSGSEWVIPTTHLLVPEVRALLESFQANEHRGVKWSVFRYDASEADDMRRWARESLEAECRKIHARLLDALDRAQEAYDEAERELPAGGNLAAEKYALLKSREKKARYAVERAGERLDAAIKCAEAFDETDNVQHLLDGLQKAIDARVRAVNLMRQERLKLAPPRGKRKAPVPAGPRKLIFGRFSANQLLNWMGQQAWDFAEAKRVLLALGVTSTDSTIQTGLSVGRPGNKGKKVHLDLTFEEIRTLRKLEKEAE